MTTIDLRRRQLHQLGAAYGLELKFEDNSGRWIGASDLGIEGVLTALGVPVSSDAEIADALGARRAELDARAIDPVIVVRSGSKAPVLLRPMTESAARSAVFHVNTEAGDERSVPLRRLLSASRHRADGRIAVDLSSIDLPLGYHSVALEVTGRSDHAQLLVRPGAARRPTRAFGIFAPLYGLRARQDWGIGSTTELGRLGAWARDRGASFVGTLPLYPAFYDDQFEVSPYRPVSRVGWNEIFLDVAALPELGSSAEAGALVGSRAMKQKLRRLHLATEVEYAAIYREKRAVLEQCAVVADHGPRAAAFEAFLVAHPEIKAYALFRSDREGGSAEQHWRSVQYHQFVQFAMDAALAHVVDEGVPLYLDLPLGVHPAGFDPAHYPTAFLRDASIGAPPDGFFIGGQRWGIPPLHPEGIREGGFSYLTATLRHLFRHAAVVRLDHVMGLERCFVIPDGLDAADGAYLRYPSVELRAVAAIEAERSGTTLVGEDLGTVPPETRRAMARDRMLRSAVFQLEASGKRPAPKTEPGSMASFGTHDLPRFAEFATGGDIAHRLETGAITRAEAPAERVGRRALREALADRGDGERGLARAYRGFLRWLGATGADLAIVDLGDLLLDPEPENRPGPTSGETSWRHRLAVGIEEIEGDSRIDSRLALVAAGRPKEPERKRR